jgi:hypothetical protein
MFMSHAKSWGIIAMVDTDLVNKEYKMINWKYAPAFCQYKST